MADRKYYERNVVLWRHLLFGIRRISRHYPSPLSFSPKGWGGHVLVTVYYNVRGFRFENISRVNLVSVPGRSTVSNSSRKSPVCALKN